jgi:aminoglycoside 6'-N-acetyltransferase I
MIRSIRETDAAGWLRLRRALWPDGGDDHPAEVRRFFEGTLRDPYEIVVAERDGELVGFAEVSTRTFAEGCATGEVGYLEGWYVVPGERRRGIGRALVAAAEDWARARGCTEFGSDTALDNEAGQAAHRALGFEQVGRAVCYRKAL